MSPSDVPPRRARRAALRADPVGTTDRRRPARSPRASAQRPEVASSPSGWSSVLRVVFFPSSCPRPGLAAPAVGAARSGRRGGGGMPAPARAAGRRPANALPDRSRRRGGRSRAGRLGCGPSGPGAPAVRARPEGRPRPGPLPPGRRSSRRRPIGSVAVDQDRAATGGAGAAGAAGSEFGATPWIAGDVGALGPEARAPARGRERWARARPRARSRAATGRLLERRAEGGVAGAPPQPPCRVPEVRALRVARGQRDDPRLDRLDDRAAAGGLERAGPACGPRRRRAACAPAAGAGVASSMITSRARSASCPGDRWSASLSTPSEASMRTPSERSLKTRSCSGSASCVRGHGPGSWPYVFRFSPAVLGSPSRAYEPCDRIGSAAASPFPDRAASASASASAVICWRRASAPRTP